MNFSEKPSAEVLKSLLGYAEQEGMDAAIIERLKVILHFAEHEYSISETCRFFGISRSTFHRWMERFDPTDLRSLQDRSHEPVTQRQSTVTPDIIELIRRYRMRYPNMGKERIAELLTSDHALQLSASSVGRIIERECLYFADTPFHWKKRLACQKPTGMVPPMAVPQAPAASAPAPERAPVLQQSAPSEEMQKGWTWRLFLKFIVFSSVVANIAFLSFLLAISIIEYRTASLNPALQASSDAVRSSLPDADTLHAAPTNIRFP